MAGKKVWLVHVEQIAFVTRELVVKLVVVFRKEPFVEANILVESIEKEKRAVVIVQRKVSFSLVELYRELEF